MEESFKTKIYNKIFKRLVDNTESFKFITKKYVTNINTFPMIYLSIENSTKINDNGILADMTNYEIYIVANNSPENSSFSGNEILLDYVREVEFALARPMNWDTNHLGFEGYVIDSYFTNQNFYDDETSGSGLISAVLTFSVIHIGEAIVREYENPDW